IITQLYLVEMLLNFFVFLSQNLEERLGKRAEISQLLFKNRCNTVNEIIEKALYFFPKTFINFNIFKLIFYSRSNIFKLVFHLIKIDIQIFYFIKQVNQ